jgi:HK97 family phage major capsid protein
MKGKKKEKLNVRELVNKYQVNCDRIGEIAETCEKEQRERTEAEDTEFKVLTRENQLLQMKMQAASMARQFDEPAGNNDERLRELLLRQKAEANIVLVRELMTTAGVEDTGIIPVQEEDMLKPLRAGLIYDKVGIKVMTGLVAGKLRWPRHGKAVAQWAGEGERLVDAKIDFSKLDTKPVRLGLAIPVTREELESSEGIVESVVREEMPNAVVEAVNEAMFTTEGTYKDANDSSSVKNKKVVGPFVAAAAPDRLISFAGTLPTRKELLKMRASVSKTGIKLIAPCWVMTEDMKTELEDVKVDAGSGRFLVENGMLLGSPIFTTPYIGEGYIGFGDWSYQASGFFGPMSIAVDPYTLLRQNSTDFVLNSHFATVTLYDEAFVVGKVATAGA